MRPQNSLDLQWKNNKAFKVFLATQQMAEFINIRN